MENEKLNEDFSEALKENSEKKYDMILVIVNKGYTDLVMEAARRNGARGGTIMTARGTGNPSIEKFYQVTITPEKEIVLILVDRTITDKVLKAVYDSSGLQTPGQGIAFAIPAGRTAGLTATLKEAEDEAKESEEEAK